ncbi:ATP-grasp domain-containing protein [Calothrix sp. FACHB-1219]|uniref:ATP-grasp domain-containing protein n=1 Tax=unclassified Calothrix TaxID=2619626 RepID=UPI001683B46E|nr:MULTISPECIES: ATP-grasp domain-containing protein [unclassified Calothrix]MBD2201738.1 ATP-grasp domain-containing protein [Calothrix sp. FACHB-168]MBD2217424.1 ATP-grasp domain-containing protein [Calothrix sp. FACHB-1219]
MLWVVERGIFQGKEEEKLIAEIKNQGHKVIEVLDIGQVYSQIESVDEYELANREPEPIIFRGSLKVAKYINRYLSWWPGAIFNHNNFKCSTYYTYLGPYLLNDSYHLLPFRELQRKRWELMASFYRDGGTTNPFIRPDSPMKIFHGDVYSLKELNISPIPDPSELVLIAPYKEIKKEYRFVVTTDRVISGASYSRDNTNSERVKDSSKAWNFVEEILDYLKKQEWSPDELFVVDIASSIEHTSYRVVEINSFSCSALYSNDLEAVVKVASQVAEHKFKEIENECR